VRVWLDAQTGKQARLMATIARRLMEQGYEVLVTGRDYEYTRGILETSGVPHVIVGSYGGSGLEEKLEADIERMKGLLRVVREFNPDVLVSYPIPASVRVAYGLAKPIIVLSDSPHSRPVHQLTIPLADYLVHSSLIPTSLFNDYLLPSTRVVVFDGVEEWEWVGGHHCTRDVIDELGVEPGRYVVLRTPELKAVYYRGKRVPALEAIVEEAIVRGLQVVAFPRYREDKELLEKLAGRHPGMVKVVPWDSPVETLDLYCYAWGVVTGGATMAREASLMCKPAVSLYPVYINLVLEKLGLPIRSQNDVDVQKIFDALEDARRRGCNRALIERFEKPSAVVSRILAGLAETR